MGRLLKDLAVAAVGLVSGLAAAAAVHTLWWYSIQPSLMQQGPKGPRLGVPDIARLAPVMDPAHLFAGAVVGGLVLGLGRLRLDAIALRVAALVILALVLTNIDPEMSSAYTWCPAFVAFGISLALNYVVTHPQKRGRPRGLTSASSRRGKR
ncbi:MAG: hypothetical protein ACYC2X_02295 [Coriobacteriia bacterium]